MKYPIGLPRLNSLFGKATAFFAILIVTAIADATSAESGSDWTALSENSNFAVAPEPSTWAVLILGASILLLRSRKRRS